MRVFVALGLLAALLHTAALWAQPAAASNPVALYEQGIAALEAGDWPNACRLFEASFALARRASVQVRLGECRLHEQHYVEAWQTLQAARALNNESGADHRVELNEEIKGYLAQVPTVQVSLTTKPADVSVTIDGRALSFEDIGVPLPVELGEYQVAAEAPGYARAETKIKVTRPKQAYLVALTLRRIEPAVEVGPAPPPANSRPAPEAPAVRSSRGERTSGRKTAAYVLGAGGIISLGAAGALGAMTLMRVADSNQYCQYSDGSCDQPGVKLRNEALRLQTAGLVVAAVGAVALSTGVFLLVTTPTDSGPSLALGVSGSRLALRGAF